jgi:hypothetical protein
VLRGMEGAGAAVADPVLLHHERLDGFGYPRGVTGEDFSTAGQLLAIAEWLMALLDSDYAPLTRAKLAPQLMPGEFSEPLLALVSDAAQAALAAAPPNGWRSTILLRCTARWPRSCANCSGACARCSARPCCVPGCWHPATPRS